MNEIEQELLAACRRALSLLESSNSLSKAPAVDDLRAAIGKAEAAYGLDHKPTAAEELAEMQAEIKRLLAKEA